MEAPPRRVLLFGLSANPPTGARGHMGLLAHCRALRFDEVWLLPVFRHIFASKRRLAPFRDRLAMLRLAVADALPVDADGATVVVSEYERELFERLAADGERDVSVGSIDLVAFLRDQHPETRFTMLVGADAYADLLAGKWKRGDELRELVDLLVVDRAGVGAPSQQQQAPSGTTLLQVPQLGDVSSTKARAVASASELAELVTPSVAEYIQRHKLYSFAGESDA